MAHAGNLNKKIEVKQGEYILEIKRNNTDFWGMIFLISGIFKRND